MYAFEYHRPTSVAAAVAALKQASDGKLIAGGQTLLPTLKLRLAQPSDVIDLGGIVELRGIRQDGDRLVIGAMTPHGEVAASDMVAATIPGLAQLAGVVGDPQVRNRGTIGGSIANNDPAADYPAAIVALGATVHTDRRAIGGDDFFKGLFETALAEDELITQVSFPRPEASGYAKFRNPASRFALVGVMVAKTGSGVRVAVVGAAPCVFRVAAFEQALNGSFSPDALKGLSVSADGLNSDIHASADYRAHLVRVMAQRAVAAAR
jgi:carbon-monoxide dehydrogenase medium subunit